MAKPQNKDLQRQEKARADITTMREQTVDTVLTRIQEYKEDKKLHLPADYSVENAMKSAWLKIQEVKDKDKRPALEVCTTASIANSLLDMAIQGLNPVKNQCYFIVYGKVLELYRSYLGNIVVAMRVNPAIKNIFPVVIYEGDQVKWSIKNGLRVFEEHTQSFANIVGGNVLGAYAVAVDENEKTLFSELMTLDQLKEAWSQSIMKPVTDKGDLKAGSVHARFTDEMAKKTVINRLCKRIIGASNDKSLLLDTAKKTDEIMARTESQKMIEMDANKGEIIDIAPRKPEPKPEPIEKKAPPEPAPDPAGDEEMSEEEIAEIQQREMQEDPFKNNNGDPGPGF